MPDVSIEVLVSPQTGVGIPPRELPPIEPAAFCPILSMEEILNENATLDIDGAQFTFQNAGGGVAGQPKIVQGSSIFCLGSPSGGTVNIHGVVTVIDGAWDLTTAVNAVIANDYSSSDVDFITLEFGTELRIHYKLSAGDISPSVITTGDCGTANFNTVIQAYQAPIIDSFVAIIASENSFEIGSSKVFAELTLESIDTPTVQGGIGLNISGADGFVIIPGTGSNDGFVAVYSDIFEGPPSPIAGFENLNITTPYTLQLRADGNTGDIFVTDGTTTTLLANIPGLGSSQRKYEVFGGGNFDGEFVVILNADYEDAEIDPEDYVGYCKVPVVPPLELIEWIQMLFNIPNPDLIVNEANGTYDIQTTDPASTQSLILTSKFFYKPEPAAQPFLEGRINSFSDVSPDNGLGILFGQGFFGGLEGIICLPGTADGVATDGKILNLQENVLLDGFSVTLPWAFRIRIQESDGGIYFEDNQGRTLGPIQTYGPFNIFDQQFIQYVVQAQIPAIADASMNYTVNTGGQLVPLVSTPSLPAGYVGFSEVLEGLAAYRIFDFSSEGDVTIDNPPLVGLFGRTININKDGAVTPEFTGSFGTAAFTTAPPFTKNLYEITCTKKDSQDMSNKIVRFAANAVFSAQLEIATSNGFSGVDGVDGTDFAWMMRTFSGISSVESSVVLFNHVEYGLNDGIGWAIESRDPDNNNYVRVQYILHVGGETIIYDWVNANLPADPTLTFTPIGEMKSDSATPLDDDAEYLFSGEDADYQFSDYPNDLTDIQGRSLSAAAGGAYVREALLVPFAHKSQADGTMNIDVTRKIATFTAGASATEFFAHLPLAISMNEGIIAVEMEITTVNASQTNDYYLKLLSPNQGGMLAAIGNSGGNLTLFTAIGNFTIKSSYTPQSGDRIAILIRTDDVGGQRTVTGYLDDGALNKTSFNGEYANTWEEHQQLLVHMGHGSIPAGENTVITSKAKAAEMSSTLTADYPAGTKDIEGVTI